MATDTRHGTTPAAPVASARRIVVGFSGGVTSAWCAGWALRTFPPSEVVLLFHDTKEEHPDTYRFIFEFGQALQHPITERSDGRSVTEVFYDEGFLGNNQNAMCSRILKVEQGDKYVEELRGQGVTEIVKVLGFSSSEWPRIQRMAARCAQQGIGVRFPVAEEKVSKQACADYVRSLGVRPSAMYEWADHANCVGCVKGGRAYWLAVREHHPEVFEQRAKLEEEFGHEIIRGGDRERVTLRELAQRGLKCAVPRREAITIGPCECGD